jgi:aminoglycoside phosphotransferase
MASIAARQDALLHAWLGDWELVADHSWPLQDTTVIHVRNADGDHIVKASTTSHHIERELRAHEQFLNRLHIPTPQFEYGSVDAGVLVTRYLPGELVLGTPAEHRADVYQQAGAILRDLQCPGDVSSSYLEELLTRARETLDLARGLLPAPQFAALGERLDEFRPRPVRLYFTHGDYQPRNWLYHDGKVSIIDFGRALQRSWVSDLVRLQHQQFVGHPDLERAFLDGMGRRLTEHDLAVLEMETLQASVGTIVWAHRIHDGAFERHGREMVARVLEQERT